MLTTLHTNDAAGTIVRFQALGEKPANIAPALNLAIGQRLVRKVCKECVQMVKPTLEQMKFLKKELKDLPKSVAMPSITKIPKIKGCDKCNKTGYKGRVGIFEFFLNNPEMETFILKSPSVSELMKKAKQQGMASMREDGLIKVLEGKTTIEEINRTTKQ